MDKLDPGAPNVEARYSITRVVILWLEGVFSQDVGVAHSIN